MATEKMLTLRLRDGDEEIMDWLMELRRGDRAHEIRRALKAYIRSSHNLDNVTDYLSLQKEKVVQMKKPKLEKPKREVKEEDLQEKANSLVSMFTS